MAFNEGVFELSGKLGKQVFSVRNGRNIVKGVSDKPHQLSEASKKSGKDFGTASTATKLIRMGFESFIAQFGDDRFDDRLKSLAIKVVNTGPAALKGKRQFTDGDVALLKGLVFNKHAALSKLLHSSPVITLVPGSAITIALPRQKIAAMFSPPAKAAEAVMQFYCCLFYFNEEKGVFVKPDDLVIPLDKISFAGGSFQLPLEGADNYVIMLACSIHFLAEGNHQPIQNRQYFAASLLEVMYIANGVIQQFQPEVATVMAPVVNTAPRVQWVMNEEE